MKIFLTAAVLGGAMLGAGCVSDAYSVQSETVSQGRVGGVTWVATQQFLATEGLFEENEAGTEYIVKATNTNSYKVCVSSTFVLNNIEARAMTLEHKLGYFLDPGQTKNVGYVRFARDVSVPRFGITMSPAWHMDAQGYCVPTN